MEAAAEATTRCALCGAGADVHCAADAAFLCAACDAEVHGANFLASCHRRTRVSAPKARADDHDDDASVTSSTSCLSTADSATTTTAMAPQLGRRRKHVRARRGRGEAVLEGWAKRMRVVAPGAAARAAARALQEVAVAAAPRVPLRVAMAGALWREVAARGSVREADGDALRRLEACARVPARLVVAVASAMGAMGHGARVKRAVAMDTEEGWGECS